jgi:hypothetical protein
MMDKNRNSVIGELKGKVELLINEVLPRMERSMVRIEKGLNNHLKHHVENDSMRGDRWFKIFIIILQIILSGMVSYLLFR